jgi:hypothetical protein
MKTHKGDHSNKGDPALGELEILVTLALRGGDVTIRSAWYASYHLNLLRIVEASIIPTWDQRGLQLVSREFVTRDLEIENESATITPLAIYPLHLTKVDYCAEFCWHLQQNAKDAVLLLLRADAKLPSELRGFGKVLRAFGANPKDRAFFTTPEGVLSVLQRFNVQWRFAQGNDLPLQVLLWGLYQISIDMPASELADAYADLDAILNLDGFKTFGFAIALDLTNLELHLLKGGDAEVKAYYESYMQSVHDEPLKALEEQEPFPSPSAT